MRNIIFRGKRIDTEEKEWVFGNFYLIEGALPKGVDRSIIVSKSEDRGQSTLHIPVDIETIGQYTGLKDKNGKMIFEGDIVESEDEEGCVKYQEEFACFALLYNDIQGTEWKIALHDLINIEVKGNICDANNET